MGLGILGFRPKYSDFTQALEKVKIEDLGDDRSWNQIQQEASLYSMHTDKAWEVCTFNKLKVDLSPFKAERKNYRSIANSFDKIFKGACFSGLSLAAFGAWKLITRSYRVAAISTLGGVGLGLVGLYYKRLSQAVGSMVWLESSKNVAERIKEFRSGVISNPGQYAKLKGNVPPGLKPSDLFTKCEKSEMLKVLGVLDSAHINLQNAHHIERFVSAFFEADFDPDKALRDYVGREIENWNETSPPKGFLNSLLAALRGVSIYKGNTILQKMLELQSFVEDKAAEYSNEAGSIYKKHDEEYRVWETIKGIACQKGTPYAKDFERAFKEFELHRSLGDYEDQVFASLIKEALEKIINAEDRFFQNMYSEIIARVAVEADIKRVFTEGRLEEDKRKWLVEQLKKLSASPVRNWIIARFENVMNADSDKK